MIKLISSMQLFPKSLICLFFLFISVSNVIAQSKRENIKLWKKYQDEAHNLHKKGLYVDAITQLEKAFALAKDNFGDMRNGEFYHDLTLKELVQGYRETSNYAKALYYYDYAIDLTKASLGEKHPDYATLLTGKGLLLEEMAHYEEAFYFLNQAKEVREEVFGKESFDYVESLTNLGGVYSDLGKFDSTLLYFEEALEIARKLTNDGQEVVFAYYLDDMALIKETLGKFDESYKLLEQARALREEETGNKSLDYSKSLYNLGMYHYNLGEYNAAEAYLLEAADITLKELGENHPEHLFLKQSIALVWEYMGKHTEAETLLKYVLKGYEKSYGKFSPDLVETKYQLATVYYITGYHKESQALFEHTLLQVRENLSTEHPLYAQGLLSLAQKHFFTHHYTNAEYLYKSAITIYHKIYGTMVHPALASTINDLGILYDHMGLYKEAMYSYRNALDLKREIYFDNHPDVSTVLNNIGVLFVEMKNFDSAGVYFQKALDIKESAMGSEHHFFGFSLANMGVYYKHVGEYDKAMTIFREAMEINRRNLGDDHPLYIESVKDMAHIFVDLHETDSALKYWKETLSHSLEQLHSHLPYLDPVDKSRFHKAMMINFEMFYSFVLSQNQDRPDLIELAFEYQTAVKELLHHHREFISSTIEKDGDKKLLEKLRQWQEQKAKVEALQEKGEEGITQEDIEFENAKLATLEMDLAIAADSIDNGFKDLGDIPWTIIRDKLKQKEALVQVIRFKKYLFSNDGYFIDSIFYSALIITRDSETPTLVNMTTSVGKERQLQYLVSNDKFIDKSYTTFYQEFWQPILEKIPETTERIFIDAEGMYDYVSFERVKSFSKKNSDNSEMEIVPLINSRQMINLEKSGISVVR